MTPGTGPLAFERTSRMPEDPVEPAPIEPAPPLTVGATGLPSNIAAALAVMIPLVGGVVFLFLERKDRLIRFYSIQSIVLGVVLGGAKAMESMVEWIFTPIPIQWFVKGVIWVASSIYGVFALCWLVVYLIALFMAFSGRYWAIPYLGPMAKRYITGGEPEAR